MKKAKLVIVLALILSLIGCQHKNVKTSLEKFNLNGQVKSITSVYYLVEGTTESEQFVAVDEFNDKGFLKKSEVHDSKGEVIDKAKYTYSTEGNLIKVTHSNEKLNGYSTLRLAYNKDNLETTSTYYDSDSRVIQKIEKTYMPDTQISTVMYFDSNNNGTTLTIHDYDDDGQLRMVLYNDLRTDQVAPFDIELDERGNRLVEKGASKENPVAYYRTFDEFNNLLTDQTFVQDQLTYDQGFEYEYDALNNWIVQKEMNEGTHIKSIKRTFEYYE